MLYTTYLFHYTQLKLINIKRYGKWETDFYHLPPITYLAFNF